ncbi:hypothetical protein [Algoriphagus sediminis]|uniref:Uncharacterized protein n=1 Tax=Algoriphagus sediminis TaxID=3057113 RepID=A0ABT7Y982_9BACT|nr:hypothetical protein [Algoriphagus sediminis]MDN3203057.1 hypothetical protein [Algoriphagus sediminis]
MKKNQSRGLVLILLLLLTSFPVLAQSSIVGAWEFEKDPEMVWVFTEDGGFDDDFGNKESSVHSSAKSYSIQKSGTDCNAHSTDPEDMKYLSIDDGKGDSMCYYLETLSEEYLVLMDTYTGKLLIFKRKE